MRQKSKNFDKTSETYFCVLATEWFENNNLKSKQNKCQQSVSG